MLTDYHTHTYRCGHAVGRMDEYVEAAIRRGIGEIGLSDHLYLYFDPPERRDARWAIAESEYDAHYAEMLETRERFRGTVAVRVAVEADFVAGHEEQLHRVLSRYEFDYVLGGVHFMDGWLIDDPEQADRYRQERVAEIYRRYYANVQKAIRTGAFDLLAHFDLPKKFGDLPEEDLGEIVADTLDLAKDAGIAIEVSTAGLRKPVSDIYPSPEILREMRRRGIPVALSSDAHDPADVGFGYDRSVALLREVGYTELITFSRREPRMVPLG